MYTDESTDKLIEALGARGDHVQIGTAEELTGRSCDDDRLHYSIWHVHEGNVYVGNGSNISRHVAVREAIAQLEELLRIAHDEEVTPNA